MALKLRRDEVRWARSPSSLGKGRLGCSSGGRPGGLFLAGRKCLPLREQHFVAVYSENSGEVVSIADYQIGGMCWCGLGTRILLGGKGGSQYEGLECRA